MNKVLQLVLFILDEEDEEEAFISRWYSEKMESLLTKKLK